MSHKKLVIFFRVLDIVHLTILSSFVATPSPLSGWWRLIIWTVTQANMTNIYLLLFDIILYLTLLYIYPLCVGRNRSNYRVVYRLSHWYHSSPLAIEPSPFFTQKNRDVVPTIKLSDYLSPTGQWRFWLLNTETTVRSYPIRVRVSY